MKMIYYKLSLFFQIMTIFHPTPPKIVSLIITGLNRFWEVSDGKR